jgi:predicted regulator of Ras-like GTPase activity (Roadblock/LC7/MglB family)
MKDVLLNLNKEVGVKGSMVVTRDGVVVAAEVHPPLNGDTVAAIASNSIQRVNASLASWVRTTSPGTSSTRRTAR